MDELDAVLQRIEDRARQLIAALPVAITTDEEADAALVSMCEVPSLLTHAVNARSAITNPLADLIVNVGRKFAPTLALLDDAHNRLRSARAIYLDSQVRK